MIYQMGGHAAGVRCSTLLPHVAPACRLTPRLAAQHTPWFGDLDMFTADFDQLQLDGRTRRCPRRIPPARVPRLCQPPRRRLQRRLIPRRRQLRHLDPELANALDSDNTARVIDRVAEVLRHHRPVRHIVAGVQAQASLLRQLRNYGVHPRSRGTGHLERYFTDSGAAILLMQTHTYLTGLATAVDACVAGRATGARLSRLSDQSAVPSAPWQRSDDRSWRPWA